MRIALAALALWPLAASAQDTLQGCAGIDDAPARLACYDRLAGREAQDRERPEARRGPLPERRAAAPSDRSAMVEHWNLDDADNGRPFQVLAHNPVYALPARLSTNRNQQPHSPAPGRVVTEPLGLDRIEAKFQLSLKTKAIDDLFGDNGDLWFAYTQVSNWQAYNGSESSPFRENDFAPEVFLTWRTGLDLLGWRWQMVNFGAIHESNGRDQPLSRSWNRLYAQFGFERDDLALYLRPWWRIDEFGGDDDNPDIEDFLGYGDLRAVYRRGANDFALLTRYNPDKDHGAIQLDWHFPLLGALKGYVQVFSGYGETLIDYNHKQTTLGVGVSLVEAR